MASVKTISSRPPGAPAPKVSVAMITYKQERFITQAVESAMMQKTDFPYELVISDDCSPDRTREIALELQRRYPDRIRLLLPETNLGMMSNFVQTLRACTGDYIALLEGDDYWIDARKLQKQADLLDAHPEFPACFTRAQLLHSDDPDLVTYSPGLKNQKEIFAVEDLIEKNYIATASVLYRNFVREIDFAPFMTLSMGDWPLHILASQRGPIGFCPEVMAVYRLHKDGVWTAASEASKLEAEVRMYRVLRNILPDNLKAHVARSLGRNYRLIAKDLRRKGQKRASLPYFFKSLAVLPLKDVLGFK